MNMYVIFDNYNGNYEEARKMLIENGNEDPTESEIWDAIYDQFDYKWDEIKENLDALFNGNLIAFGTIGRWDGKVNGWDIYRNFDELFSDIAQGCSYWKLYEEKGHLRLQCSHHDGTNLVEIKKLTDKGYEYYDRWNYGCDNRKPNQVGEQIVRRYSHLPHYTREFA